MCSDLPKVLHPLAGQPLLAHVISTAKKITDIENIFVVAGFGKAQVLAWLAHHEPKIKIIIQEEQLGTGHAVAQCLPYIASEKVLVLYGDVPSVSSGLLEDFVKNTSIALGVLTTQLDEPQGFGRIIRDSENQVIAIVEEKDANDKVRAIQEVNTGIILSPTAYLKNVLPDLKNNNKQGEYYLTDVVELAHQSGQAIHAMMALESWRVMGINNKGELAQMERNFQKDAAKALMEKGLQITDPQRFDLRGNITFGVDCSIDVNVILEGDVVLGNGIKIGPNTVIRNSTLGDGVVVEAFSHIDGAVIGTYSKIGPFARVRPDTLIGSDCKIGNFVEIKKSSLKQGSKVSHLSYIGDATLGEQVNVGAGTVTCNYDGVNKHHTEIGDGAFIGSGSMLVAPLCVGKGATIGAGSTITESTPDNQLVLARTKQRAVPGWTRPKKVESKGK